MKGNFLTPEPGWKCVLAFFAFDEDVPGSNRHVELSLPAILPSHHFLFVQGELRCKSTCFTTQFITAQRLPSCKNGFQHPPPCDFESGGDTEPNHEPRQKTPIPPCREVQAPQRGKTAVFCLVRVARYYIEEKNEPHLRTRVGMEASCRWEARHTFAAFDVPVPGSCALDVHYTIRSTDSLNAYPEQCRISLKVRWEVFRGGKGMKTVEQAGAWLRITRHNGEEEGNERNVEGEGRVFSPVSL